MKRRRFLAASAALPFALNRVPVAAAQGPLFNALGSSESDRVLVLVQLSGGNDGLNTLIPLDQYDVLANLRSNVILPQNTLLSMSATRALHPAMTGVQSLWDDGNLGIVQDVAYPNQNRSHFRSTDIWHSGSPSDEVWTTGWLGRYLEGEYAGYPNGFPNAQSPDPIAMTIGNTVSETCQGLAGNFSLAVNNPGNFSSILGANGDNAPNNSFGRELTFVRQTIEQSNAYSSVVTSAYDSGSNVATYPTGNRFADRLRNVARLISGGLQTKVYIVSLGGFDTHAAQVMDGSPTEGAHTNLLKTLSEGLRAFQSDLKSLNLSERVIGMTYSEFGRRIRSNDGLGTDHGTAAPAFLFGDCVNAGVLGNNPTIDPGVDEQEGVAMQYDFRDVYGSVLEDWFGVEPNVIRGLLHDTYVKLPVIRNCNPGTVSTEEAAANTASLHLRPTAFAEYVTLSFELGAAQRTRLTAYDAKGGLVETLFERRLPAGPQQVRIDASAYPRGPIFFHLQSGEQVRVVRGVRQ